MGKIAEDFRDSSATEAFVPSQSVLLLTKTRPVLERRGLEGSGDVGEASRRLWDRRHNFPMDVLLLEVRLMEHDEDVFMECGGQWHDSTTNSVVVRQALLDVVEVTISRQRAETKEFHGVFRATRIVMLLQNRVGHVNEMRERRARH